MKPFILAFAMAAFALPASAQTLPKWSLGSLSRETRIADVSHMATVWQGQPECFKQELYTQCRMRPDYRLLDVLADGRGVVIIFDTDGRLSSVFFFADGSNYRPVVHRLFERYGEPCDAVVAHSGPNGQISLETTRWCFVDGRMRVSRQHGGMTFEFSPFIPEP